jgi:ornithine cyclodeaminase
MRTVSAEEVHRRLDYPRLIDALRAMFRDGCAAPVRHHHTIERDAAPDATLLLMPAWQSAGPAGGHIGVKVATVFPGNADQGLPAVMASYLLMDGATGEPRALIDGTALTARRTAAASALAATWLAREDTQTMVMVGTGALAPHLIQAHATIRPIRRVAIWGRRPERARAVADDLSLPGVEIAATEDLEGAVRSADLVSCATLAAEPLVRGAWLKPGAHLDLVGAFTPALRESDDEAVARARLFVDTRAGALKEGGDIVDPMSRGVISESDILGDLYDLARGAHPGRRTADEITLFKSVGAALEDLAAAIAIWDTLAP